jgi:hypothetical protein
MAENGKEELQELNCLVEEICGDNFALLAFPSNTFGNVSEWFTIRIFHAEERKRLFEFA